MSQSQGKQVSFQEYVNILRNNIVLSYDSAKEQALKSFDAIVQKLDEQLKINQALQKPDKKPEIEVKKQKK